MLSINEQGQIDLNISHLQEDKPQTLDDVVNRYSNMDMKLFYHIVSAPTCRYEKKYGRNRIPKSILGMSEEERFKNILKTKKILGNPKSFFVNKSSTSYFPPQIDEIKSVSFSLASQSEMKKNFLERDSEYGICFFHDFLLNNGLRQVVYLNDQNQEDLQKIVFSSPYLMEVHSKRYDMRWENEWRIKEQLEFSSDDIAFLIVPDEHYERLINEFLENDELIDYFYLIPSSTYTSHIDHLLRIQYADNDLSFSQLPLFRVDHDDGLLMEPSEFPELLANERVEMTQKADSYLKSLTKSTIHHCYERRFTQKFLKFIEKLNKNYWNFSYFPNIENIKKNANEPWYSHNDLTVACYEILFNIQRERIVSSWNI